MSFGGCTLKQKQPPLTLAEDDVMGFITLIVIVAVILAIGYGNHSLSDTF